MKISLNWLKTYLDLDGVSADELCRAITFLGFEVEQVIKTGAPKLDHVVVGEILTRGRHPNADKLSVCTVDVGAAGGVKTIVCGAPNCDAGNRVPVALPGAVLPGNFEIKLSKIRGHESQGMMCSAKELTLSEEAAGLLLLPGAPTVGTPINDVLPPGDTVFDIEVTPNRPDCLSHLGIARELGAWFRRELKYPEINYTPAAAAARSDLLSDVEVRSQEDCPLYAATVITGVKVGPSPAWLQERLTAVGLRPINNIVDISNYVLLEYGQPTHCFDARRIGGGRIIVRRAAADERLVTLDGKARTLNESMLVIADAEKPLVVAGVMGGEDSGVSTSTTDIVLEAAVFRRQIVRSATKQLGLTSDSSYRFERGVDPHSLEEASHRAIDLILSLAGGQVAGDTIRRGGEVPWQREIVVTPGYVNEKLGFEIPADDMRAALEALDLVITREEPTEHRGPAWTVSIPSWRDDLDRPIDLVEEILRVYGTERIPASTVLAPGLVGGDDPIVNFNRQVATSLAGQGFVECVNYTLREGREVAAWTARENVDALALSNPFVEDQSHLRTSLIGGLVESVRLNQSRGATAGRLFETGRVFLERNGSLVECVAVGFVLVQDPKERAWLKREGADFYTAKRVLEGVAAAAGIDFARQPLTGFGVEGWQEGHAAVAGDIAHGWTARLGLVDVALLRKLGVEGRVIAGHFALLPEKLGAASARKRYQPLPQQPAALRDLALVVDESLAAAEVQKAVAKAARAAVGNTFAVEAVQVFDVYRGTGLPEGKKSLAFSLTFRAPDRTLTDEEVNSAFSKLQEELARTTAFQIRK
ncbi:phenylalanine--tRNA ligase subunit beta [Nibricoccus sp. IMCC34717]|uniref:phenylalanine--tRNA ligase subunit beta n=1 Tax=Nibricoccus sp. IMCC34717 TaxID=3034021 RepID=UPI00384F1476